MGIMWCFILCCTVLMLLYIILCPVKEHINQHTPGDNFYFKLFTLRSGVDNANVSVDDIAYKCQHCSENCSNQFCWDENSVSEPILPIIFLTNEVGLLFTDMYAALILSLASVLYSICYPIPSVSRGLQEKEQLSQSLLNLVAVAVLFTFVYLVLSKQRHLVQKTLELEEKSETLEVDDTIMPYPAELASWNIDALNIPALPEPDLEEYMKVPLKRRATKKTCHLLHFRQFQQFNQVYTVCPATVNLLSHFASGTYGHPTSNMETYKEGVRLATFSNFPKSVLVSTIRLAQAGFFYTGERDTVRCFSCGTTYSGWVRSDRPAEVHARISPDCPLVQGNDSHNLSLPMSVTIPPSFPRSGPDSGYSTSSFSSQPSSQSSGVSNAPSGGLSGQVQTDRPIAAEVPDSGPPALGAPTTSEVNPQAPVPLVAPSYAISTPTQDGSVQPAPMLARRLDLGRAVYPLYSQMDARKRSFTRWDENRGLPSEDELIRLGFFYAGYADCVRCFFCGIGLKSWEPGDIPAEVHAKWRPTCEYLRLVKGDAFVDQVANSGSGTPLNQEPAPAVQLIHNLAPAQTTQGSASTHSDGRTSQRAGVEIPDLPIVQTARGAGYTDDQIIEAILKLRSIGMELAMDVLLVDVLNNLYRDSPPQPQPQPQPQNRDNPDSGRASAEGNSGGNNSSASSGDMQHDGEASNEPGGGLVLSEQEELQQENARLRGMRTCQNCHERVVGSIFLPCGHIVSCTECAPTIRQCTRCKTVIRATANVFFS